MLCAALHPNLEEEATGPRRKREGRYSLGLKASDMAMAGPGWWGKEHASFPISLLPFMESQSFLLV
jgi:hypothetical protein